VAAAGAVVPPAKAPASIDLRNPVGHGDGGRVGGHRCGDRGGREDKGRSGGFMTGKSGHPFGVTNHSVNEIKYMLKPVQYCPPLLPSATANFILTLRGWEINSRTMLINAVTPRLQLETPPLHLITC
jgi:hypothetical protein